MAFIQTATQVVTTTLNDDTGSDVVMLTINGVDKREVIHSALQAATILPAPSISLLIRNLTMRFHLFRFVFE